MSEIHCAADRSPSCRAEAERRSERGFARSDRGSALVEYALLLGAVVCALAAGLYYCDDLGFSIHDLNRALANGETDVAETATIASTEGVSTTAVAPNSEAVPPKSHSQRAVGWQAILFCAAAILGLTLWLATRFRRRSRKNQAAEEANDLEDENRIHLKRQVLWKNILNDPRLLFKNRVEVRHLMTRDVSVIAKRMPIDDIRQLMAEKHMHHVLVCDSDGRLEGVVSDRDLYDGQARTAGDVMSANPVVVRPDSTAGAAIATLLEKQISCVPVVDDDRLCGILTRTDLLLSLQCMLQWWLRFAQTLAQAAECSDKIDDVQEASGRRLFEQRIRLQQLSHSLGPDGKPSETTDWNSFTQEAEAFIATAGELIAMQTFEGDRLSEMAGQLLEITKS